MQESPYLKAHAAIRHKFEVLPLIGSLCHSDQRALLRASRIRRFDADEIITREGDYEAWIYILIQGHVEVSKSAKVLAQISEPGETFGELCLIDRKSRSATVRACRETICLAIDSALMGEVDPQRQDAFYALIYRMFAELLAARLRAANEEIIALQQELQRRRRRAVNAGLTS